MIFIYTLYDYFLYESSYASDSTQYLFSDRIKCSNLLNIHIIKQMIWKFQTDVAFCIYDIYKCILTFKYWYMFQFRTPNSLRNNAHKHHNQNTYYALIFHVACLKCLSLSKWISIWTNYIFICLDEPVLTFVIAYLSCFTLRLLNITKTLNLKVKQEAYGQHCLP